MRLKYFILNTIASSPLLNFARRKRILKWFGLADGDYYISDNCYFTQPDLSNITLGHKVYLNSFCYLDNAADITIGDNTALGVNVEILTTTHKIADADRRVGNTCIRKPVTIGKGVWLCGGVWILPGAVVGDGCVVAAGSVVLEDAVLEPHCLYAGIPAVLKKRL